MQPNGLAKPVSLQMRRDLRSQLTEERGGRLLGWRGFKSRSRGRKAMILRAWLLAAVGVAAADEGDLAGYVEH